MITRGERQDRSWATHATAKTVLCWHLAIVTALTLVSTTMLATEEDASIGGALIGLLVVAGGLPWSVVALLWIDTESSVLGMIPVWLCAVLNAVPIYLLLRRKERPEPRATR